MNSNSVEASNRPPLSPAQRLLQLVLEEKKDLWIVMIYGLGAGLFSLGIPIAVQSLVNTIGFGSMIQPIFILAAIIFLILSFSGVIRSLQNYLMEIIEQRIFVRMALELGYRLPRVQMGAYDSAQGPELVNRFFDVLVVQKNVATIVLDGVVVLLQTILGMILLAFYHPYLLAFDCILLVSILTVVIFLGKNAIPTNQAKSKAKYEMAAWLGELASNPLLFKSYGGAEYALHRSDALSSKYVKTRKAYFKVVFSQFKWSVVVHVLASSLLLGLGGWLVVKRQLTLGQLVASELVLTSALEGFLKIGKYLESYYDLVAAADKLGHLLDLPLESQVGEIVGFPKAPAALSLKEVSFQYRQSKKGIQGLTLDIQPGSRVAFLGGNGSGKSTLVDLIFGLRKVDQGSIIFDGVELREIPVNLLRTQIALVRGTEVFDGTVMENIRVNRTYIPLREIRQVLSDLNLLEDIEALPEGLLTRLSGGQHPLSAGQLQRLMLARAIVGRPRMLILDESMDSIDSESFEKVCSVLFNPSAPWTLLLTTHNKSLAKLCGEFYSLSNQTIEKGIRG